MPIRILRLARELIRPKPVPLQNVTSGRIEIERDGKGEFPDAQPWFNRTRDTLLRSGFRHAARTPRNRLNFDFAGWFVSESTAPLRMRKEKERETREKTTCVTRSS